MPFDITLPEDPLFDFKSIVLPIGTATFPFSIGPSSAVSSVALVDPGTGRISDILALFATQTGTGPGTVTYSLELDFLSAGPGGKVIDPPGGFITFLPETGGLQNVSSALFAPFIERPVSSQPSASWCSRTCPSRRASPSSAPDCSELFWAPRRR